MRPMPPAIKGTTSKVNSVSCQLMANIVPIYTRMKIGFLMTMSSDDVILLSISLTSVLTRARMSPLRSSEKNERGNERIFL